MRLTARSTWTLVLEAGLRMFLFTGVLREAIAVLSWREPESTEEVGARYALSESCAGPLSSEKASPVRNFLRDIGSRRLEL